MILASFSFTHASLLPVPYPFTPNGQKQVCKVSVGVYLFYKNTSFHRKVKKESRQNEFLASFSKQMNRIDKYCIAFSCFFINFLHLLKNAFAFGFKRKCVLLKTQVRFESKRKYVLVETQGRFPEASGEG